MVSASTASAFQEEKNLLLTTEIGGEGRNLRFCSRKINYDLPWNPMKIEQRIGRIHRIGQHKEVAIYNVCTAGSLERSGLSDQRIRERREKITLVPDEMARKKDDLYKKYSIRLRVVPCALMIVSTPALQVLPSA